MLFILRKYTLLQMLSINHAISIFSKKIEFPNSIQRLSSTSCWTACGKYLAATLTYSDRDLPYKLVHMYHFQQLLPDQNNLQVPNIKELQWNKICPLGTSTKNFSIRLIFGFRDWRYAEEMDFILNFQNLNAIIICR